MGQAAGAVAVGAVAPEYPVEHVTQLVALPEHVAQDGSHVRVA